MVVLPIHCLQSGSVRKLVRLNKVVSERCATKHGYIFSKYCSQQRIPPRCKSV